MAQVASTSDPKSKGGGSTKKQGAQKPGRQDIEARIAIVKDFLNSAGSKSSTWDDEAIERVLEKHNYNADESFAYIFGGGNVPTSDSNEWQQVTRNNPIKESKAKPTEKKEVVEKKDKENRVESDKRNDRDDKRDRSERKPKRSELRERQPSFKEGGENTSEGYRAPRDRDAKPSLNGSPHGRAPRRTSAPVNSAVSTAPSASTNPGARPPYNTQKSQLQPHASPHIQSQSQHAWGPPAQNHINAPAAQVPPSTQSSQPQTGPSNPNTTRPASFNTTTQASYSKIVQGRPQQAPPQYPPISSSLPPSSLQGSSLPTSSLPPTSNPSSHPSMHQAQPAANASASATSISSSAPISSTAAAQQPIGAPKSDFSPLNRNPRSSPQNIKAWQPKEASPILTSATPAPAPTISSFSVATPVSSPAATQISHQATQPQITQTPPAPHQVQQQTLAQIQASQLPTQQATQIAQPTAQVPQVQSQPSPISLPTSVTIQPKKQPLVIDKGLRLPRSLIYEENLSFQFGNVGLDNKPKDFFDSFGSQPTSQILPAQSAVQPVHASTPSQSSFPAPVVPTSNTQVAQPTQSAHHIPTQQAIAQPSHHVQQTQQSQPQQPQLAQAVAQQTHIQHPSAVQQPPHAQQTPLAQQPSHVQQQQPSHAQPAHPAHVQQHMPAHVAQQPSHLSSDHTGMVHMGQSSEDLHLQYPGYYMPPGSFHMPFGFSDGNPDERSMRPYYDHANPAAYGTTDTNAAQSSAQQNSQSPPPQSTSQYPMQSYYYPPSYMHPYYQTSGPTQFQQFPGYNMPYGKPNYGNYRMSGGYSGLHGSGSPANAGTHSQYDEAEYGKYVASQGSYSNFYAPSTGSATSVQSAGTAGSTQGMPGSGSSVAKPAQSYSPNTPAQDAGKGADQYKYASHRNDASSTSTTSFYNNMGHAQQPNSYQQHTSPFMQHSSIPHQNMSVPSQTSAYHAQPLSNSPVPVSQSGTQQRSHYSSIS